MADLKTKVNGAQKFEDRWKDEFAKQAHAFRKQSTWQDAWQGIIAYRELHRRGQLYRVDASVASHSQALELIQTLWTQVSAYKRLKEQISGAETKAGECFEDVLDALSGAEKRLRKVRFGDAGVGPYLSSQLNRSVQILGKKAEELRKVYSGYWLDEWSGSKDERMKWPVYFDADNLVHSIPPDEITGWEERFGKVGNFSNLNKRIDLDRQFRLRIAVILRHFLPCSSGVTLQTVSRLVVLTYICGELSYKDHNGDLRVVGVRKSQNRVRALSPGAVAQTLQAAKIK
jgi:hypothetical protein